MRPGPHGFTFPSAPDLRTDGWIDNRPFLIYQYWWDEDGHRVVPFDLVGGYGESVDAGEIKEFSHYLDISSGLLTVDLHLSFGSSTFSSQREIFVTPEGVLVIRVTDGEDCNLPFILQVKPRPIWPRSSCSPYERIDAAAPPELVKNGLIFVADRPNACRATMAVVTENENVIADKMSCSIKNNKGNKTQTFFLAPGSSYESNDPVGKSWDKVTSAANKGFERLRDETRQWWTTFWSKSHIVVPDEKVMCWYLRSMYYLGVYFGNTDIPPGCFGTNPAGFYGAVCPEFDLPLNVFALLYSNHLEEAGRVANWLSDILERARDNARHSEMHNISVTRSTGAFYGPLIAWDGRLLIPPTPQEAIHLYEKYPSANVAAMALAYADFSNDREYASKATLILREIADLMVEDLVWSAEENAYKDKYMHSPLNLASIHFVLRECNSRKVNINGDLDRFLEHLHYDWGTFYGRQTIFPGNHRQNTGDAPWLQPLWWFRLFSCHDPKIIASYDLIRHSPTGKYVFNNGWMAVHAAKLYKEEDAFKWVQNLANPSPGFPNPAFDDTNFCEIIYDWEDSAKTPEIAAHASLVCGLVQMMLDPDDTEGVALFPALPSQWRTEGVSFKGLLARGGVVVAGNYRDEGIKVSLSNLGDSLVKRQLRIRCYGKNLTPDKPVSSISQNGDWIVLPMDLAPGDTFEVFLIANGKIN